MNNESNNASLNNRLSDALIGSTVYVESVLGEGRVKRRLFDMGITPGAEIYVRKKAPLGDPIEVTIRNYELTLRKTEAEAVVVRSGK
ncbi:MAG TPA: hypothetical protein DEF61_05600 [Firmicutes bacterium]|nr:hypothetical protein [Bacillota bacterium]HBM70735.1 hypothetical protein [Bacillota bacterium]HBX25696.1 hypothetical protein [Bacillota bacterium]